MVKTLSRVPATAPTDRVAVLEYGFGRYPRLVLKVYLRPCGHQVHDCKGGDGTRLSSAILNPKGE